MGELLSRCGQVWLAIAVRGIDHGLEAGGHPEALSEHARIERSHPGGVRRQPPCGEAPGALLVGPDRDGDADRDARRSGNLATRLALLEQSPPLVDARSRPEERRPFVSELAGEADRARGERREHEGHRHVGDDARAQGPRTGRGFGSRSPLRSARTAVNVSRRRTSGWSHGMP